MQAFQVTGGRPLRGSIPAQGAKNAALPILAATLAARGPCTVRNCPDISDVHTALAILRHLGCEAAFDRGTVTVDTGPRTGAELPATLAGRMRSSVTFLGALLAAAGEATVPLPGGCVLGARPLDLHLQGLEALGARLELTDPAIRCHPCRLRGGCAVLRYPSVGATENLMLAALGAEGPVTLIGAAKEPEIADLADFLTACGAKIDGAGTGTVRIVPRMLHGCTYTVMPDRMAAATYLCAAAATGGDVTLTGVRPGDFAPVTKMLRDAGCRIDERESAVRLRAGKLHAPGPVVTAPYPGFPTDAQAPVMAALLKAEGVTVFRETVFENRFRHVPALLRLGADVCVEGELARVRGVGTLHGGVMEATDLRGGAAMLIAALSAEGESRITGGHHLLRGYERLTETLQGLGAAIHE